MPIKTVVGSIATSVLSPVADVLNKRTDRKQQLEAARGKIALAKQSGDHEVTLTDAQWELLAIEGTNNSWKDEYLTILITSPIIMAQLAAVADWHGTEKPASEIVRMMMDNLTSGLGLDYAVIATAVVFAGIGLKYWRR